jgi:hypothetical protein
VYDTVRRVWLPWAFSSGWASGVSAYLAVLQLGLLGRFLDVGGVPDALMRTDVMIAAGCMYAIEFVTDKIPFVDTAWDVVHTVIRPAIGVALGLLMSGDADTLAQAAAGATGGVTAFLSHATKASARLVLNASPEPITNITASVGEDLTVASVIALLVVAPWVAASVVAVLLTLGLVLVWRIQRRVRQAIAARRRRRSLS